MKLENKILLIIIMSILLFASYFFYQIHLYHAWVKNSAIEDFEACMVFEREDLKAIDGDGEQYIRKGKGEKHCLEYARNGDLYSPYPIWKALMFKNPLENK